jgi:hypothetical protein
MAAKKKKKSAAAVLPVMPTTGNNPSKGKTLHPGDPGLTEQEKTVAAAVQRFEEAEKTILLYEQDPKFAPVIKDYKDLLEERDQLLQVAEHMARSLEVSCGPFIRTHVTVKWDANQLYQLLGEQQFLAIGGTKGTETVYTVDKDRADIAMKTGAIPAPVAAAARKESPAYRAPKPKS